MTNRGQLVLIVEDDPQMLGFMRPAMTAQGLRVLEVETFTDALHVTRRHAPDLVVLDRGVPDAGGVEFIENVRSWSRVPIIVISARGDDVDKVTALDAGADDYLTKPFALPELLARVRVALRHASVSPKDEDLLFFGPLSVDRKRHEIRLRGKEVHLTPIEYKLLVFLAENAGRVLTRRRIVESVWGSDYPETNHNIVVRMGHLRNKLETDPRRPQLLITVPGVGYRLREAPPEVSP